MHQSMKKEWSDVFRDYYVFNLRNFTTEPKEFSFIQILKVYSHELNYIDATTFESKQFNSLSI